MRTVLTAIALAAAVVVSAAAQSKSVYKIGDGVKAPELVREVKPIYPRGAMDRKVQGVVELKVVVQSDGTVGENVQVTKSLDPDLDDSAITAVKQWSFRPGTKDGTAVDVEVNVEMTFTIRK